MDRGGVMVELGGGEEEEECASQLHGIINTIPQHMTNHYHGHLNRTHSSAPFNCVRVEHSVGDVYISTMGEWPASVT